jgi:hypothetical protein
VSLPAGSDTPDRSETGPGRWGARGLRRSRFGGRETCQAPGSDISLVGRERRWCGGHKRYLGTRRRVWKISPGAVRRRRSIENRHPLPYETRSFARAGRIVEFHDNSGCLTHEQSWSECVPHVSRDGPQDGAKRWSPANRKIAGQTRFLAHSLCFGNGLNQTVNP